MAEAGSWPSIGRHGLLSTTALLDLFEIKGEQRQKLEGQHRRECVTVQHPKHGQAVIRDQKPMDDSGLRRALRDMNPEAWYLLLNSKVFFWLCEERVTTLLSARAYSNREHCVLVVDAPALVRQHEAQIWLAPMNTGCTKPMPHPRGSDTFQRIHNYPYAERRRQGRQPKQAVVELAVDYAVPNVRDFVLRVERRHKDRVLETLWSR